MSKKLKQKFDIKYKTEKDKLLSDINVSSKKIEIKCRKVLISKELEHKIKNNNDYKMYINKIENDIKTGVDLNKYLSKLIYDSEFNDKFYIATRKSIFI